MADFGAMLSNHIPALVMVLAGYVLLIVEMYIPGFGLAGVSGTLLMGGGIVLMHPTPLQALVLVLISVVLLGIAFSIAMHSIAKGRLSKSKLVLNDVLNSAKDDSISDLDYFVGLSGTAHTVLRPAGIAEINGVKLNVVSDGDFIDAGKPVTVQRIDGTRIVVREAETLKEGK
ncbi:MAG: hypothetical protein IJ234_08190 [Clostridia bacterium]|nr:hypothetical protein [Clostridia bacterium]